MLMFTHYMSYQEQSAWARQKFPVKLHRLLEMLENPGAAAQEGLEAHLIGGWNPDGKSFRIYNTDHFVGECLPYFFNQTKFKSYQRQLGIYGFKRITANTSPVKGSYFHPSFGRDVPSEVIATMQRKKQASERNVEELAAAAAAEASAVSETTKSTEDVHQGPEKCDDQTKASPHNMKQNGEKAQTNHVKDLAVVVTPTRPQGKRTLEHVDNDHFKKYYSVVDLPYIQRKKLSSSNDKKMRRTQVESYINTASRRALPQSVFRLSSDAAEEENGNNAIKEERNNRYNDDSHATLAVHSSTVSFDIDEDAVPIEVAENSLSTTGLSMEP